jgi:hypothetical protein
MKKIFLTGTLIALFSTVIFSQTSTDALRYSRILYNGTARFQGLGGAFGAVGADFSVLATNPAGIGLYKSSEITLSPTLWFENSSANYNNVTATDNKANFAMGNFGFVFTIAPYKKNNTGGLKSFNIGFGMNRQNNYNSRVLIEGPNNKSSLMTSYVNTLNSQNEPAENIYNDYPFDIGLAYNANLIVQDSVTGKYFCDAPNGGVYQQKNIETWGSINEFEFSFGGNYDEKLYFGATIGMPIIRYFENSQYQEVRNDTSVHMFRALTYDQTLETHGTGINFKAGLIYRPANWVRLGASIHTPTFYGNMRDSWNSTMTSEFDYTGYNSTQFSPAGSFNYQLTTPFRAIGSIAFIIGNYGMVTGEYEYVNYDQARFYSSDESFTSVNDEIKSKYKSPVNVRVGTEWRIQNFRVRGGFGYYGSPYQSNINNGEIYSVACGAGYRGKHLFFDMAYIWSQQKVDYYLYDSALVNPSNNTYTSNNITWTFGVRF